MKIPNKIGLIEEPCGTLVIIGAGFVNNIIISFKYWIFSIKYFLGTFEEHIETNLKAIRNEIDFLVIF